MAHKSTALQVAGRTVRIVVVNDRLYVPLRFLIEESLDMQWSGQRKRLAGLAERWKMADLLVAGKRKTWQQPCLPAGMLPVYLWMLRPTRPDTSVYLERLRDKWDGALMAYLGLNGVGLAHGGAALIAEIGHALVPLIQERERLEDKLAEWQRANPQARLAKNRWSGKAIDRAAFHKMAQMNSAGIPASIIAKEVGCSRTCVSLFLDGKYETGEAGAAFAELAELGWKKHSVTCGT